MRGNDISNEVVPRLVIVWDGLLGVLPSKAAEAKASTYLRLKRWKKAVSLWEVNDHVGAQIWDLTWRSKYAVDLVTHTSGEPFAEALAERLYGPEGFTCLGQIWYEDPRVLARSLAHRPNVACVVHDNPQHVLLFGSKGRYLNGSRDLRQVL